MSKPKSLTKYYKIITAISLFVIILFTKCSCDNNHPVKNNIKKDGNMRHVSPNMRHVSPNMRHVSPNMRHVSPDMRHVSPDMRHVSPDEIDHTLHKYSHFDFHGPWVKKKMFEKISNTNVCMVAGVEWGKEVYDLNEAGCNVYGYEPNFKSFLSLQKRFEKIPNIHIFNKAIGKRNDVGSHLSINYHEENFTADFVSTYDELKKRASSGSVGLLSVDTNSNEHDIISDASDLLHTVEQVWLEIWACNPKNKQMLNTLSKTHKLYDFAWWGRTKEEINKKRSEAIETFEAIKSTSVDEMLNIACKILSEKNLAYFQTDIVAIRKDIDIKPIF